MQHAKQCFHIMQHGISAYLMTVGTHDSSRRATAVVSLSAVGMLMLLLMLLQYCLWSVGWHFGQHHPVAPHWYTGHDHCR